jgi:hypothetical protein
MTEKNITGLLCLNKLYSMVHLSLNFYPFNFATILTFIVMLLAIPTKPFSPKQIGVG